MRLSDWAEVANIQQLAVGANIPPGLPLVLSPSMGCGLAMVRFLFGGPDEMLFSVQFIILHRCVSTSRHDANALFSVQFIILHRCVCTSRHDATALFSTHPCLHIISFQHKKRMNAWALYIKVANGYTSESTSTTRQKNDLGHSHKNNLLVAL